MNVEEISGVELDGWDAITVDSIGGHVYQSLAWAAYRSRHGWVPRYLALGDGSRALVIERPWPIVGGRSAWISRGPVPYGADEATSAVRLDALAGYLGERGVDVVASDAEIPAGGPYAALLRRARFHPIEELQASRHRMAVAIEGRSEADLFAATQTRVRRSVRQSERQGLTVFRLDRHWQPGDGEPWRPFSSTELPANAFARAHGILRETARRRDFGLQPMADFVDWCSTALEAGHLSYLEVRTPTGDPIACATFLRHGRRLTYAFSGGLAETWSAYPGAGHLLVWRAAQLAVSERLLEFDLGGVDVRGARHRPREGEPMYGLYDFKRSFGAEWVELTGSYERIMRPVRYLAGRIAARVKR